MTKLNSTNFSFTNVYLRNDLEFILSKIYECYKLMLKNYSSVENDENKIRNRLYKDYLENDIIRNKLNITEFLFDSETEIINDDYSVKGRTDIKVYNAIERTKKTSAYYIIECKRLDGNSTLNKKYINNGIQRFINQKYPVHKNINAMLGFIVKTTDVSKNSKLLGLTPHSFIPNFTYSYRSIHKTKENKEKFSLYHLMLDFSSKIK